MEHNQLILSAKDVNIQFNLRGKVLHAIRGIDLDLYQGEVLAIDHAVSNYTGEQ